jgi:hypothetical protein
MDNCNDVEDQRVNLAELNEAVISDELYSPASSSDDPILAEQLKSYNDDFANFFHPSSEGNDSEDDNSDDDTNDGSDSDSEHTPVAQLLYALPEANQQAQLDDEDEDDADDSDSEPDEIVEDGEAGNVQKYIRDTIDGTFMCCNIKCLSTLHAGVITTCINSMHQLTQARRRELLHIAIACSVVPSSTRTICRKRKLAAAAATAAAGTDVVIEGGNDDDGGFVGGGAVAAATATAVAGTAGRKSYEYRLQGTNMCRAAFLRLFCVGVKMLKFAQAHAANGMIVAPADGRGQNRRGCKMARTAAFVVFLKAYADLTGYSDPSGRGGKRDQPVMYLKASLSKITLYNESYVPEMQRLEINPLKYASLVKYWKKKIPQIKIRKPKTDICDTCCKFNKWRWFELKRDHLGHVIVQRNAFNADVEASKLPGSIHVVLTFDFAEKFLLPMYTDTPKAHYYQVGLKMDLFGIADNTKKRQHNWVLAEGHWPNEKGINPIASMLWINMRTTHADKTYLSYMADNCAGQNKNLYMMWFMAYAVLVLNFTQIFLRFLIAGHTKNFCDACFGLARRNTKGKDIFTPRDLVGLVRDSAICNEVEHAASGVVWYDWKAFLAQFFSKKIPLISDMHEFWYKKENPGVCYYKRYANEEQWLSKQLFKPGVTANDVLAPTGNFRPLSAFEVSKRSYAPLDQAVTADGTTRRKYLEKTIIENNFVGDYAVHSQYYMAAGGDDPYTPYVEPVVVADPAAVGGGVPAADPTAVVAAIDAIPVILGVHAPPVVVADPAAVGGGVPAADPAAVVAAVPVIIGAPAPAHAPPVVVADPAATGGGVPAADPTAVVAAIAVQVEQHAEAEHQQQAADALPQSSWTEAIHQAFYQLDPALIPLPPGAAYPPSAKRLTGNHVIVQGIDGLWLLARVSSLNPSGTYRCMYINAPSSWPQSEAWGVNRTLSKGTLHSDWVLLVKKV